MIAVMELLRDHLCSSSWWRAGCEAALARPLLQLLSPHALPPPSLLQALGLGQALGLSLWLGLPAPLLVAVLPAGLAAAVGPCRSGGERSTRGSVPESLQLAGCGASCSESSLKVSGSSAYPSSSAISPHADGRWGIGRAGGLACYRLTARLYWRASALLTWRPGPGDERVLAGCTSALRVGKTGGCRSSGRADDRGPAQRAAAEPATRAWQAGCVRKRAHRALRKGRRSGRVTSIDPR
jgi:hypothetical protein